MRALAAPLAYVAWEGVRDRAKAFLLSPFAAAPGLALTDGCSSSLE
jgi:hypothetical protein